MQVVVFLNIFLMEFALHWTLCHHVSTVQTPAPEKNCPANIEEVEARGIQLVADLQPHSEMPQNPTHWTF